MYGHVKPTSFGAGIQLGCWGCLVRRLALLAVFVALGGCSNHFADPGGSVTPLGGETISTSPLATTAREEEAATLTLSGIRLNRLSQLPSPSRVSDEELLSAAAPVIGKKISIEGLRSLATTMEGRFRSAGYPYARVILPPQKVEDGLVTFNVIEGWIDGVTVLGPPTPEKVQTEVRLRPLDKTGPVEVSEIERTVALLQRVPGLKSHVAIARGGSGPGAMKLVADAAKEDPNYLINIQNSGSRSLGREGATVFASIPGAAPLGDEFQFAAYNTFDYEEQMSLQAVYERGLTLDGLTARLAATYAEATPSGPVATLGLASESVTADASLSHPIYLRRKTSLDVTAGFAYADFTGELFSGTVPFSDDRTRSLYVSLDGETRFDGWKIEGGLMVKRGLDLLDASKAGDANLARPEAEPDTLISMGNLRVESPRFHSLQAAIRVEGQYAVHPLMAVDEFSFGNYTILRGYDPGAAAGDSAIAAAFDVSGFRQSFWNKRIDAELTGFYDVGKYWNQDSTGTEERSIASVGGGVRITLTGFLRADLTYAVPLNAPLGQGEGRPDPRLLFSVTADAAAIWERLANAWAS